MCIEYYRPNKQNLLLQLTTQSVFVGGKNKKIKRF